MSEPLQNARILVADDQPDVAAALTKPLKAAGADLRLVQSGVDAFEEVRRGGYDLLVLDLKMPPEDWGGLWVLEQLREARLRLPTLMLSGEGGTRQLIQAQRMGSEDWVEKDKASAEIEHRVGDLLGKWRNQSLGTWRASAPTPLAHMADRYESATRTQKEFDQGVRLLEGIVRFAALVGLATIDPLLAGPLPNHLRSRLTRPSFGTWWDLFQYLTKASSRTPIPLAFSVLARCIVPTKLDRQRISALVKARNDQAHGDRDPTVEDRHELRALLTAIVHRINGAWSWWVEVATAMTFNRGIFTADTIQYVGLGAGRRSQLRSSVALDSWSPLLVGPNGVEGYVVPWIQENDGNLVQMDGGKGNSAGAALNYTDVKRPDRRQLEVVKDGVAVTWAEVAAWIPGAQTN